MDVLFDDLMDDASLHFLAERIWMEDRNHPEASYHCAEHEKFIERITQLYKEFSQGKTEMLPLEIMHFLHVWLSEHISKSVSRHRGVA